MIINKICKITFLKDFINGLFFPTFETMIFFVANKRCFVGVKTCANSSAPMVLVKGKKV